MSPCGPTVDPAWRVGVLFDWDGTLVDTEPLTTAVWDDVLTAAGTRTTQAFLRSLFPLGWPAAYHAAAEAAAADSVRLPPPAATARLLRATRRRLLAGGGLALFPDTAECLSGLRAAGARLGVVTNSDSERLVDDLAAVKLPPTFWEVIVTADEVAAPKPAPDPYVLALHRLGPVRRVVAVEDSGPGVTSARAAGLPVIWLQRGARPLAVAPDVQVVGGLDPSTLLRLAGAFGRGVVTT